MFSSCFSVPLRPLYKVLAQSIVFWGVIGETSIASQQRFSSVNQGHTTLYPTRPIPTGFEGSICHDIFNSICSKRKEVMEFFDLWLIHHKSNILQDNKQFDQKPQVESLNKNSPLRESIIRLIDVLQLRGFQTLLGLQSTVGSIDALPPSRCSLISSFNALNDPSKSQLTVGARALTKHFHRSSSIWWGFSKGTEIEKNRHADSLLRYFLSAPAWINLHGIVHGVRVFEIRVSSGYGVRWQIQESNVSFRGFLVGHF